MKSNVWQEVKQMAVDAVSTWKNGEFPEIVRSHPASNKVFTFESIIATEWVGTIKGLSRMVERAMFTLTLEHSSDPEEQKAFITELVGECSDQLWGLCHCVAKAEVIEANKYGTRARKTLSQRLAEARAKAKAMTEGDLTYKEDWQLWADPLELVSRFEEFMQDDVPVADRARLDAKDLAVFK